MQLTIERLFNDHNIVSAVIDRVLQTRTDAIYWRQFLDFRQTTTRVFKAYLGTVTGVMAGSVNSRYGEKPIRERRNLGYGYGEVAYLGDAYQMSVDRLSEVQDLIDKFNAAKSADQAAALDEIIAFVADDYRQVTLAAHKRMDLVVGSLLMTGAATVKNKDNRSDADAADLLSITLPLHAIKPAYADVYVDSSKKFISYLMGQVETLRPQFGSFAKMVMTRKTFNDHIIGSSEFGDKFKAVLGSNQLYVSSGLISSDLASDVFTGIGLPAIEIKSDYVQDQNGSNTAVYADDRITLIPQDKIGSMRWHVPYEATDPVPGRNYTPADGGMLISNYRDKEGRYMEYTAEWIPQFDAPNRIVNFDLSECDTAPASVG